jgi:RNA polymerase sigma-70 factor (ECF subfamily)
MQIAPELLRDAQAGNPAAFNHIVIAYRRKVIGTVARMIGRPEDAEDVAQEVFTRLYFNLKSLKDTGAFEIWLHRMTANAAYDYLRGPRGRRRSRESRMSDVSELQMTIANALAAQRVHSDERNHERIRDLVDELLAAVSDADRILLILREIEGLSLTDLERIYGTKQNALKVRLFRARQRVLKAFESEQDSKLARLLPLEGELAQ